MNTFYDYIVSVIGNYSPIVTTDTNNNIVDVSTNWGYILGIAILIIFIFQILKTIGGIIYEWCRK